VRVEPSQKLAVVFVDGQNLFHAARDAFGCTFPDYDISALAKALAARQGWVLAGVRFYTCIPEAADNAHWHHFWTAKLAAMGRQGVGEFRTVRLRDGTSHVVLTGEEKGIDVRIALDVIAGAHRGAYDVALILSQDQDLSEVATEIRVIGREQDRWIKIASAFPVSPAASNRRGINSTDWIPIDRALYDRCLDRRDYRAGGGAGHGLGDGG